MIWFASAAIASFFDHTTGFWAIAIGGVAIFPLTRSIFRLAGRRAVLSKDNSLNNLGMQIAFTVPLVLPLAGAAALHHPGWFYPACMVIVGAHYLPFIFLYGMKTFAALSAAFICAAYYFGFIAPGQVVMGGWVGAMILFVFAFGLLAAHNKGRAAYPVVSTWPTP